jgi:hypothetical protein
MDLLLILLALFPLLALSRHREASAGIPPEMGELPSASGN